MDSTLRLSDDKSGRLQRGVSTTDRHCSRLIQLVRQPFDLVEEESTEGRATNDSSACVKRTKHVQLSVYVDCTFSEAINNSSEASPSSENGNNNYDGNNNDDSTSAAASTAAVSAVAASTRKAASTADVSAAAEASKLAAAETGKGQRRLLYSILDVPPVHQCILLGLQHFITMLPGTVLMPTLLFNGLCITEYADQSAVISTTFFVMGLATLLQTILGTRLPIIQGASSTFIMPNLAILASNQLPSCSVNATTYVNATISSNGTVHGLDDISRSDNKQVWMERISYIGGTLAVSSVLQVFLGVTGLTSVLLHYLGPLVIGPTICVIGISLVPIAARSASSNWYIALLVCLLIIVFSHAIDWVTLPLPTIENSRVAVVRFPLFKSFPVLLSVGISCLLCYILTVTNVFSEDPKAWSYLARTDIRSGALTEAAWLRFPYPGQFGTPRILATGLLGMMSAVIVSVIESIGDYIAAARLSGAPRPPLHAINRGIMFEGMSCILAGVFGVPTGSTSYSENIGAIGITQVGSRLVVQVAAGFMVLLGFCPKIGAVFVCLPQPVVGGLFLAFFSLVTGVGLSSLQYASMSSQRNIFVVGFSIVLGLAVPYWLAMQDSGGGDITVADAIIARYAGSNVIARICLEIIMTLLMNNVFITGFTAFLLDNTLSGSRADRGFIKYQNKENVTQDDSTEGVTTIRPLGKLECYDLPYGARIFCGPTCNRFTQYLPFLPKYPRTVN